MHFKDRHEAGIKLAEKLEEYKNSKDVIVLAIPRGGVETGYEIARFLNVKLDIVVTKKIGLHGDEEFAIGSVGPDKKVMLNQETIRIYNVPEEYISRQKREIGKEIERRYKVYKGRYQLQNLKNKIVILTDDGIATGFTTKAAVSYAKSQNPKKIILAVPVSPSDFSNEIKKEVDEFVCLHSTSLFFSISQFYDNFPQLTDEQVKNYLNKANAKNK
ncbi:phosphoribosyltransferase [Candidatus Woesearchaeota archaeon]|nr:phosphoribosyltransferase [Candidatus Woesearchaeota archaeon]